MDLADYHCFQQFVPAAGPPIVPGDQDGDGDVDLDDFVVFVACLAGPEVNTPPLTCTEEQFDRADLDNDNDVDLGDYGGFQQRFTGAL